MLILPGKSSSWGAAPASYVEQGVNVPSGAYLTSSAPLGAGTYKSLLFFSSIIGTSAVGTRRILLSMLGQDSALYASYDSGDAFFGMRTDIELSLGGGQIDASETVAEGTRYHILWSAWVTGSEVRSIGYIYNTSVGSWVQAFNSTNATASEFLNLGTSAFRVFLRQDTVAHQFIGTSYRQALWAKTTTGAIADITNGVARANFASTDQIADPAISRASYSSASRIFDFEGPAANYNIAAEGGGGDAGFAYNATGTFS